MKTPGFWYNEGRFAGTILPLLLSPLSLAWQQGSHLQRAFVTCHKVPLKIICVGNLTVGGQGKTPVAMALADVARQMGYAPWFLSRGHGGSESGPLKVDPALHTAEQVGDEPLLLAAKAPTIIARNRAMGAWAAHEQGAEWIIMDDGWQNPSLKPDLGLIVVDAKMRFGNGHIVPAGPLRESVESGLSRAHAVIQIGQSGVMTQLDLPPHIKVIQAEMQPATTPENNFNGQRVVAFAGIGRPQKFFASLTATGADVAASFAFPDHYRYQENDLTKLAAMAERLNARLITTAKDHVRLPVAWQKDIDYFTIEITFQNAQSLHALIQNC
ncbi:MAG: tetraacyldisaccharide 4'-kinase [Alphaproteobacteria bacterium]|nr:tetraacyldisaccharide 4'-kinase [Alphaproteobacteria bacterium]